MNARLHIPVAVLLAVSSSATLVHAQGKPAAATPPKELSKFDDALELEPRSPNTKVAFSLQDAVLRRARPRHLTAHRTAVIFAAR